jgi:ATP-binding cassette, subfamily C, bacterial
MIKQMTQSNNRGSIQIIRHLIGTYPFYAALTIVILMTAGLLEGISLVMLLPVLSVALDRGGDPSIIDAAATWVFDLFNATPSVGFLLIGVVVVVTLKAVASFFASLQVAFVITRITADFRQNLMKALLNARWKHFTDFSSGRLASAISVETEIAAGCYNSANKMFAAFSRVVVQFFSAVIISWQVSLAALVVGGLAWLLLSNLVRRTRGIGVRRKNALQALSIRVQQTIGGMKPLKAMGMHNKIAPLLDQEISELRSANKDMVILTDAVRLAPEPLIAACLALGLYFAIVVQDENIEVLLVLALLFSRSVGGISIIQQSYQNLVAKEGGYWDVQSITKDARENAEHTPGKEQPVFKSNLFLKGVSFSYNDRKILDKIDLDIRAGEILAITGPSGTGKTTLIDILIGLGRPDSGEMFVDDTAFSKLDIVAWRSMIGYVLQETFLFHDTIMMNVTLGDSELSADDVEIALKQAHAWEFVSKLPDGMDTIVGEQGGKLSGGQRQRIAIARALARKPQLLVLDEGTTALDSETETLVCQTLRELKGQMTIIVISHQKPLVDSADTVIEIREGKISSQRKNNPEAELTTST